VTCLHGSDPVYVSSTRYGATAMVVSDISCITVHMNEPSYIAELDSCTARIVNQATVAAVRKAMPSEQAVAEVADVFALLGDPGRLRLLVALLTGGEMCVCDLAAAAGMSESAASHALRWLRAHRIVAAPRRQGRMAYYRLADEHVRLLLEVSLSHSEHSPAMHPERGHGDGA
jgi:DNA-binding transcriptional ArsR family regulator